jgi:hypothetical protein
VQKKTGPVAADINSQTIVDDGTNGAADADSEEAGKKTTKKSGTKKAAKEEQTPIKKEPAKKRKAQEASEEVALKKSKSQKPVATPTRRSGRRST